MKTIYLFLILILALCSLAPSIPPGSPVVGGPAVVAIHGVAQTASSGQPVNVRTNVVGGGTNVTTVTKYVSTNFTMNAGSLLALLENSFNTNFPPGARLLLNYEGGSVFNLIVSDSSGTNFGFGPYQVLSTSYLGGDVGYVVSSGVQSVTVTNNSGESGKVVASTSTALSFTYDDTAMSTNTTDHTNTKFFWTGLVHNKFSENIPSGFQNGNVTIDIIGNGSIRGGGSAVFTGSIQAKITGILE